MWNRQPAAGVGLANDQQPPVGQARAPHPPAVDPARRARAGAGRRRTGSRRRQGSAEPDTSTSSMVAAPSSAWLARLATRDRVSMPCSRRSIGGGGQELGQRPCRHSSAADAMNASIRPCPHPRSISVPCGGSRPSRRTCRYTGSPRSFAPCELPCRDARRQGSVRRRPRPARFLRVAPARAGAPVRQQRSDHGERPDPTTALPRRISMREALQPDLVEPGGRQKLARPQPGADLNLERVQNGATSGLEMLAARYTLSRFSPNSQPSAERQREMEPNERARADVQSKPDRRGPGGSACCAPCDIDRRPPSGGPERFGVLAREANGSGAVPSGALGEATSASMRVPVATSLAVCGDAAGNLDQPTEPADDLRRRLKQDARPRGRRELEVVQRRQPQRLSSRSSRQSRSRVRRSVRAIRPAQ